MAGENKQTEEKKLRLYGRWQVYLIGILVLLAVLIYALVRSRSVYTSYHTVDIVERTEDASTYYEVLKKGMLRYSKDGASFADKHNNLVWNQTYEMTSPRAVVDNKYFAVGDIGGNDIYIFNSSGVVGSVITEVPIQEIGISGQGVVGAVLTDASASFINLYDKEGKQLLSIRATLENTGYPLAFGMSPDARQMVISYLYLGNGNISSKLVFYDFSDEQGEHVMDEIVVEGLCPKISYLSDSRVLVYGEKDFTIYTTKGTVETSQTIAFEDEIESVLDLNQEAGFIFRNADENGRYRMEIYDISGKMTRQVYFDFDYRNACCTNNEIILNNEHEVVIYQYNGKKKFDGSMNEEVVSVIPSWENRMYWIVTRQELVEIRIE